MAIKPILFNTEMVRAILDGRKTVTRRVIKRLPDDAKFSGWLLDSTNPEDEKDIGSAGFRTRKQPTEKAECVFIMPPCQPEDILYVRETVWQKIGFYLDVDGETKPSWYNEFRYVASDEKPETEWNYSWGKRPSIHTPKEAARIWLKVTDVRVERLQDISIDGIRNEGLSSMAVHAGDVEIALKEWGKLWNSTIKKSDLDRYGWNANPYVWVLEFEQCEKPKGENT